MLPLSFSFSTGKISSQPPCQAMSFNIHDFVDLISEKAWVNKSFMLGVEFRASFSLK